MQTHRKRSSHELMQAVKTRRSIRQFLSEPVPRETIQSILECCRWSPSWGNTQPWEIVVADGEALEDYKTANKEAFLGGAPANSNVRMPQDWPENLKIRYKEVGRSVLSALTIERSDHNGRLAYYTQMHALFDAPALIIITLDDSLATEYAMLDVGLFLQSFCLLAHERGISTCIMASAVHYPDILWRFFPIPDNQKIIIGVATGFPDLNAPINLFEKKKKAPEVFSPHDI